MRFIDLEVISNCTDLLKRDPEGFKLKDSLRLWKHNQKFKIHLEGQKSTFILRAGEIIGVEQWIYPGDFQQQR